MLFESTLNLRSLIRKEARYVFCTFRRHPQVRDKKPFNQPNQNAHRDIQNIVTPIKQSRETYRYGPSPKEEENSQIQESHFKKGIYLRKDERYQYGSACVARRKTILVRSNRFKEIRIFGRWTSSSGNRFDNSNDDNVKYKG